MKDKQIDELPVVAIAAYEQGITENPVGVS